MITDYTAKQLDFKVGGFLLSFPTNILFETFNDPDNYYGVVFKHNKDRYEVVECKLGTRLIINPSQGGLKDMPFNLGTAEFLPKYVNTKCVKEQSG